MKWALLVVDVQKAFFNLDPVTTQSLRAAIEYINAAIALFREKGRPVVCVQHVDQGDNLVPGEVGFEVPDELNILPEDLHIAKTHGNAFVKTPLEQELRAMGVEGVVITGFCAEYCVLATCHGADDLDLNPVLMRGALASGKPERIQFVQEINNVISYGALRHFLA